MTSLVSCWLGAMVTVLVAMAFAGSFVGPVDNT